jgi:hypothetical protein
MLGPAVSRTKGPNLAGDGPPPVATLPSSIHASFHKPGLVKLKVYEKPAYPWAQPPHAFVPLDNPAVRVDDISPQHGPEPGAIGPEPEAIGQTQRHR